MTQTPLAQASQESALLAHESSQPGPTLLTAKKPVSVYAEKESDSEIDEKSEIETRAPEDCTYCGVDLKPVLPAALAASTILGWLCLILAQIPLLSRFTSISQAAVFIPVSAIHVLALGCMLYCGYVDPGQVKNTRNIKAGLDIEEGLPSRAHKCFLYPRPARRYDHYCKWLALHNHREFVVMVGGLVLLAVIGATLDIYLAVLIAGSGCLESEISIALHFSYCITVLAIDGPILKTHVGLISRNELGQEWKKKYHYVAHGTTKGDHVPVEDLSDEEYNEFFDRDGFSYDPSKNQYDNGCFMNCRSFWCEPRGLLL